MTDFLKIAKSIAFHFAHICAYGVETVKYHQATYTFKTAIQHHICFLLITKFLIFIFFRNEALLCNTYAVMCSIKCCSISLHYY